MHHAAIGYTDIESESIASAVGLMPQSKKIITNIAICGCCIVVLQARRSVHPDTGTMALALGSLVLSAGGVLATPVTNLDHEPEITVLLC